MDLDLDLADLERRNRSFDCSASNIPQREIEDRSKLKIKYREITSKDLGVLEIFVEKDGCFSKQDYHLFFLFSYCISFCVGGKDIL
jgi:hypothetical protein